MLGFNNLFNKLVFCKIEFRNWHIAYSTNLTGSQLVFCVGCVNLCSNLREALALMN